MKMDEVKIIETDTVKDIPPVPIKTYKWEDVRREKRKGRYPYTYLNKEPYNEEIDIAEYRMDTLKTSKSAPTLEKSSSSISIQDVTEAKDVVNGDKDHLTVNEGIVEAADSSNEDNVSQYLDKDEDPPVITEQVEAPGPSNEAEKMEVDKEDQRAKSEEPKRKRKLSVESSYSRISLSKLGVMKKLREAKEKLKLPKFSFSKSESKLDIPKKSNNEGKLSSKESKKNAIEAYWAPKKVEAPVYIHIPLKPPPGQTDEFSHLEFEPNAESSATTNATTPDKPSEGEKANGTDSRNQVDEQREGLQFIILTPPSDDETLDNRATLPDTPSSEGGKKFFDNAKLKDLKTLAKECVDEITPDMPIDGIYFEDVIQVEYVDENNRPIGTTERSNVLEVTEENLSKLEKKLSARNLAKELEKEIAASMDSLHKIARQNTLKKLKEQKKSKSSEALKRSASKPKKTQEAPELSGPVSDFVVRPVIEVKEAPAKFTFEKVAKRISRQNVEDKAQKIVDDKSEKVPENKPKEIPSEAVVEGKEEVPKSPEKKSQASESGKAEMYDEEDGLKLSETAIKMINEELAKEQLPKTSEEQLKAAAKNSSIKKKVSFKRRSKQEDPDGVYEDVRVTSDNKKVDGKEQQTKELKVIEPSQSMSVDEEKSYLDDKIIKATSLEEDYNKWSKITDHEYEPVNPPLTEIVTQPPSSPAEVQPVDAPIKRSSSKHSKQSDTDSVRIPLKDEENVRSDEETESGDALTVEEMQARIEDQFFNQAPPSSSPESPPSNVTTASSKDDVPEESQTKKIQDALKTQAGKLRTKIKSLKRPNIRMPQRPNLEKFKIQKPNISMPKIPDQMRVNLPSFTLPKKGNSTRKRPVKQYSTESNAGDSKKKFFDFSTYPRIFKRKKKPDDIGDDAFSESATVPRASKSSKSRQENSKSAKENDKKKKSPDVIRIPLHSEESMDKDENDLSSHGRYEEDNIEMDDAYLRESQQMNTASAFHAGDFSRSRWNHGSFHGHNVDEPATDDNPIKDTEMEHPQTSPEPELDQEIEQEQHHSDMRSVSSSGDVHRPGVLEKINSDEYFMQMGNYLSAEIREAFKQPTNPLAKLQADDSFDREFDVSDQSIQEVPKRKPIRKPKRKKTPNVSRERIPYDQESEEEEEYPEPYNEQPARPKRRSKKKKDKKDDRPPYQETIFVQDPEFEVMRKSASDNILLSDKGVDNHFHSGLFRQEYPQHYENERMQGIEQPNILISDPYQKEEFRYNEDKTILDENEKEIPEAPPRRQRSLKSLVSEHDSITEEINLAKQILPQHNVEVNKLEYEYIIPTPEEPPVRPARTKSRTRSQSRTTDLPEEESQTTELEAPCVEEPCVQQICDYMGYAVIEKNRHREPPLPPPTRKKRSTKPDTKFFTVPRPLKEEAPVRPVRNYSTLVPKSKRSPPNSGEDEKENVDLGQYIEIEDEDEHSRLQSGEIVQKMKDRPLPAPPRPPRKVKESDKDVPFKDITHQSNVDDEEPVKAKLEEAEASVQTEPLPDDVVCEELVEEKGDKIIIPTTSKFNPPITEFENIETVTHAALVVTPVPEDFQEGPIASFSRSTEKIITIRREVDEQDNSDIPESFQTLAEPPTKIIERIIERPVSTNPEVELLKAQKLQVSDLDVDRLTVNELLASKIKVSEIDSDSISVSEINPKSGNLVIGGLELPISFLQDIIEKLRNPQTSTENQPHSLPKSAASNKTVAEITTKNESLKNTSEFINESTENTASNEKGSSMIEDDQQQSHSDDQDPPITFSSERQAELKDEISPENTSELSPTTLQATIEYLDDLILEASAKADLEKDSEKSRHVTLEEQEISKNQVSVGGPSIERAFERTSQSVDLQDVPPLIPDTSEEERLIAELQTNSSGQKKTPIEEQLDEPPRRPPRQSDIHRLQQSQEDIFIPSQIIENSHNAFLGDSTPPPRPPDPEERLYLRSQPPPSFYVLRSPVLDDFVDEDIPMPPRRKRPPRPPSRSSSDEAVPTTAPRSRRHRTPESSIPQLTGQLTRACMSAGEKAFRRLIKHITMNVLRNTDGKQDLHVMILILLILIAGLILLGNGGNPVVHHYHWEYFNPPRDL